jgi:hypothetical protein
MHHSKGFLNHKDHSREHLQESKYKIPQVLVAVKWVQEQYLNQVSKGSLLTQDKVKYEP